MQGDTCIRPELLKVIAESIDVQVDDGVFYLMVPDVEYRIRDIVQVNKNAFSLSFANNDFNATETLCYRYECNQYVIVLQRKNLIDM